jgi:proton-coupled amino acid transporter
MHLKLLIFSVIFSITIPELELFISLFGALCLSALGISFPALIQTCAFWKIRTRRERIFLAMKNFAVIMFGLLGLIVGTYTSLEKIIHKFTSD